MLQKRLVIEWWAIFAFACILAIVVALTGFTQRFDNLLLDQAIPYAAAPPSDKILIVEIDEKSLAEIGSWPWKRSVHAQLISKIAKAKPRTISYDVLFIEPGDAEDDTQLAHAVASSGRVLLPFQYQIPGSNGREIDTFMPFAPLPNVVAGMGHVGLTFDADGLVRRVELKGKGTTVPFEHLMEATRLYGRNSKRGDSSPALREGTALLPLLPRASYRTIPASSVLGDQVSPDFIAGKFVLVGASAQGMNDIFPVAASVGSIMPGVEIQANLLNGLLADQFVSEAGLSVTLAVALAIIAILMMAFWRLNPRANLILSIAMLFILIAGTALLVVFGQYWISPGPALFGVLVLYPLWGWRRLAALNDFVSLETRRLTEFDRQSADPTASGGLDAIARQAMRLRSVIGELTDRQAFMNGVIGAAPDAMCVVDDTGMIILANDAAGSLLGEDLIGKSLPDVMACHGGYLPKDESEWAAKNGRVMLVTKSAMSGTAEDASGTIYSLSDITAIRDAERERKEMLEFLSHDMRSPQAAIVSLVDGSEHQGKGSAEFLPRIRKHAVQTLKLTEDFVQLARLESINLRADELNLADLMREAVDENFAPARAKGITITHEEAGELHYVQVDGTTIVRALSNLISNAIKYSPENSAISCRVWTAAPDDIWGRRSYCEIADEGPGLPQQRLRDPFRRFGHRDETQSVGAGLGLAFVKLAIERNGGQIACLSSTSQGTRFVIHFPAVCDDIDQLDPASG